MNHPRPIPAIINATTVGKPTIRIDLLVEPSLLDYCRQLLAEGHHPETIIHVYRGETLCFVPARLEVFANLTTTEGDHTIRFRRHYAP
ncbi:hypothetical protein [Paracoccus alkanivorans]|uniref:Uncharacterized protein n=1 Tax=Paracoccus alkanivorans TaxID=2116655 RepID=A0A3M0M9S4_9RHOB|nr:hypothetical protein [Paracoccus alkanivorans]RMC34409.1 hypothetical protein C9E81_14800 [Paracoccus alkanivorans]